MSKAACGGEVVLRSGPRSSCDRRRSTWGRWASRGRRCPATPPSTSVSWSSLVTTWIGVGVVGQVVVGQQLLGRDRVELSVKLSSVDRPLASSLNRPRHAIEQQDGGADPHLRAGATLIRLPTRAQKPVWVGSRGAERRPHRPEDPPAEDHEQRGQQGDHDQQGHGHADGEDRAEAGGRVEVGEGQAQQADDDGRGAGDDGRRGPVQRERHRLVPVLVAAELFSIAGDEQQRVVGAGADHQDAQDVLALVVDDEVGVLRQQVDHAAGHGVGERPRRGSAGSRGSGCGR